MAASEELLGMIHEATARTFAQMVQPRQAPVMKAGEPVLDEEGQPIMMTVYPTAAELAAATTFLKNNSITCKPGEDSAVAELEAAMNKRREKRQALLLPDHLASGPGVH